jgi:hypothetical protein
MAAEAEIETVACALQPAASVTSTVYDPALSPSALAEVAPFDHLNA